MTLREENGYLPVFTEIPIAVLEQSRMMVLSYPHNPTTAIASLSFFQSAVEFCQRHNLALVHDFPYVDLIFDPTVHQTQVAPSILQADPRKLFRLNFLAYLSPITWVDSEWVTPSEIVN